MHHLRHPAAVARPDHRQRRTALHAGQLLGELRRDHLGAHHLHHRRRDHDRAGRLARRALRSQAAVRRLHHQLHHHLDDVRCGAVAGTDRRIPPDAGREQRRPGAAVAGDPVRHLSGGTTRLRDGGLGHGRDDRPDPRADARRLSHRDVQLALRVLHQPAVRPAGHARAAAVHARDRQRAPSALRLARLRRAQHRHRRTADDAGSRQQPGLVHLARDHRRGRARRPVHLPVPGAHGLGAAPADPAGAVPRRELLRRARADVRGRHPARVIDRADGALAADTGQLPGRDRRPADGAARHRQPVHHRPVRPAGVARRSALAGRDRPGDAMLVVLGDDRLDAGRVGAGTGHHHRGAGRRAGPGVHAAAGAGVRDAGAAACAPRARRCSAWAATSARRSACR